MLNVRLAGLTFEDWPRRADRAYVIEPGGLTGWDESTDGRSNGGDRPSAHGGFDVPIFRSQRVVTVTGSILADTQKRLVHMQDRLTGLLSEGGVGRLQVTTDADVKWTDVRVHSARCPALDERTARFSVQLLAADPRRYRSTNTFGPAVTVTPLHLGAAIAVPKITVTGNMPGGYRINGPGGRQYVVTQGLAAGQTHEIDMETGWLTLNGVWQRAGVSRAETWGIRPGRPQEAMTLVPVSGSGLMTVRVIDTFM